LSTPGIRDRQNWVGGSEIHPGQAEFIPPTEQALAPAVEDLVEFMNGAATGCLIQAGLVHAQFETLHPFADGNGRIGRVLIHTVFVRGGLTEGSVLPISQVLLTRSDEYVAELMAFRGIPRGAEFATSAEPVRELSVSSTLWRPACLIGAASARANAVSCPMTFSIYSTQPSENGRVEVGPTRKVCVLASIGSLEVRMQNQLMNLIAAPASEHG
ncbi:Fic family protein, partial [Brevibacterium paucivorans]